MTVSDIIGELKQNELTNSTVITFMALLQKKGLIPSSMYFNGKIINKPSSGQERWVSDIVYIGY